MSGSLSKIALLSSSSQLGAEDNQSLKDSDIPARSAENRDHSDHHDSSFSYGESSAASQHAPDSTDSKTPRQTYGTVEPDTMDTNIPRASCFLVLITFLAACGSFLFGYDTGIVSGAILYLREEFGLTHVQQEAVVSVTIAAAALFSLAAGFLNHSFGRKPTIILASVAFTVGSLILAFSVNLAMLILGRMVVGIGIGLASMTVPVYIAECSPPASRGRLVSVHQLMVTIGILVASLLAGAFSYVDQGWRYMLGLGAIPSFLQLTLFVFMPESPRWLVGAGKIKKAEIALMKIRGGGDVSKELMSIIESDKHESHGHQTLGIFGILCQMVRERPVRRALLIGCGLQMFQQIAGINTVMYYTATILKMSGVRDNSLAIWLSCTVSGCNVLVTFFAVFLIDKLGRKPLLVVSFCGVFISLVVLAIGFQLSAFHSPVVTTVTPDTPCSLYSNCESCTSSSACGFCYLEGNSTFTNSSCLVTVGEYSDYSVSGDCSQSEKSISGAVWAFDFCPTSYSWITLMGMIMYIVSFAPGLAPVPWILNSEIYPLWARSAGNAVSTATNWTFNLIIAMTFLTLTTTLTKHGAYWLYAGLAIFGILFVIHLVPETKGRTLEDIEGVMSKSWIVWPKRQSRTVS